MCNGNARARSERSTQVRLAGVGVSISESRIIELMRSAGVPRTDVVVGIGDDAAVMRVPHGRQLVSCVDALVEGVHFPAGTGAEDIGWRALAVNLSDFAAMGAEPRWATLVLSLPEAEEAWVAGFARGFGELARTHEVALVGGDTVRGPRSVAVQLMGIAALPHSMLRSGASKGDDLWVSGHPGDAAAGLACLQQKLKVGDEAAKYLRLRFLRPRPRLKLGRALASIASAAIDLSDGLYIDAGRLALASEVSLQIDMGRLPVSKALRSAVQPSRALEFAATGGDDYELLFTAKQAKRAEIEALAAAQNMSCTRIGTAVDGQTVTCVLESKAWMPSHTGFEHFAFREDQ